MKAIDLVTDVLDGVETKEEIMKCCPFGYLNYTKQICDDCGDKDPSNFCEECWNQEVNEEDLKF